MLFVQFFQPSAIDPTRLVEATGDRSIVVLDGRERLSTTMAYCQAECRKRGYKAFQLNRGETFCRSSSVGDLHPVEG